MNCIIYLRKQWLHFLFKLYSLSLPKPKKNMDNIIISAYSTELPGFPNCSMGTKNQNNGFYDNINFFITFNNGNFINISIIQQNENLTFVINEIKITNINNQDFFNMVTILAKIENDIKTQLKPYFGL